MQIFRFDTRPLSAAACTLTHTALAAAVCAALAAPAHAADAISTDRPDFVESSDMVGAGRVQIEASSRSPASNWPLAANAATGAGGGGVPAGVIPQIRSN